MTGVEEDDMKGIQLFVVVVLVILTVIPGCQGASAEEPDPRDQTIEDLETALLECQTTADQDIADAVAAAKAETEASLRQEYDDLIGEKDQEISRLVREVVQLVEDNQALAEANTFALEVKFSTFVIAQPTFDEFIEALNKFYPERLGALLGSHTKGRMQVTSLDNLEKFLKADGSNHDMFLVDRPENKGDLAAFAFKARWMESGLPGESLGLLKCDRGEGVHWRNVFATMEDGEIVFYEVVPNKDEVVKVEEPPTGRNIYITFDAKAF